MFIAPAVLLTGCVTAPLSVQPNGAGCSALIPPNWKEGVKAPEFDGNGDKIGDWIVYADAATGRLDVANDRTISTIGILERCEARDAKAVRKATKRWWQLR